MAEPLLARGRIYLQGSASDYLAAERTVLAWIRTGIALMGLGFVLARFGLFLEEFNHLQPDAPVKSYGVSLWIGIALILMGVSVCLLSTLRHLRMLKQLEAGESLFGRSPRLVVGVAVALIVLGLVMAGYLIFANPNALVHASGREEKPMASDAENGIVRIASNHTVDETVAKLQGILQAKGVKLFVVVDHSGEAASAGLKMPNTKLLIFGNPKAGTPLMLAAPSVALDLPLKILVAEDAAGKTWISYNSPSYLQARHGFPAELLPNIAVIEGLAAKAAE
ncbi:MAG TPA: DUF302 domain-containing protein [Candidatus Acidoferrum sp.]|nr:DUF302 domain-containing protein [Candidatus Acidoferrum sp.]